MLKSLAAPHYACHTRQAQRSSLQLRRAHRPGHHRSRIVILPSSDQLSKLTHRQRRDAEDTTPIHPS
jgi:hypothetical protein